MVADVAPAHSTSAPSLSSSPLEAVDSGLLYPHAHNISLAATMLHNAQHNHALVTNGSSVVSASSPSSLNGSLSPASSLAVPPSFAAQINANINQQQTIQNSQPNSLQPPDANLKLFLGQIPRHVTENDLRKLFEKYGTISDLSVLRDRHTQAHRGCAFLTYTKPESAAMAIEQVHEKISLHNRPIVVRYAGAMNAPQECKLFVGMLSRSTDESRIIQLFAKYGIVKEVYLMRELNGGMSKGCAFVKLSSRDEGQYAINELNDIFQDEGAPRKLVVRFADSKANRTRAANDVMNQQSQSASMQLQQLSPSHQANPSVNFSNSANQQLIAANLAAAAAAAASGQLLTVSSLPTQHWQNNPSWNINPYAPTYNPHSRSNSGTSPTQVNSNTSPVAAAYASYAAAYPNYGQSNEFTNNSFQNTFGVLGNNNALNSNSLPAMSSAAAAAVAALQQATQGMAGLSVPNSSNLQSSNSNMNGLNSLSSPAAARGPPGSNLFIYNLPESFADVDLQQLFQPYGAVLSVRVFRDKNTGLSRGFGFVSYDSLMSAEKAISAMNGAAVGGKRIKVMHKDAEKKVMELAAAAAAAAAAAQQMQDVAQLQQLQHSFAF